jgi:HlyD family secretion protein
MNKRKIIWIGGGLSLLIAAAAAFGSGPQGAIVQTEKVIRRTITETVIASGRIGPEVEVKISAEVSGQLIALPVREGDVVKAGDLLAQINPDIYESRLSQAEAALNNAQASAATAAARFIQAEAAHSAAELSWARSESLYKQGVLSKADIEQAEVTHQSATADLEAASQTVRSAEFTILSARATVGEAHDNLDRTVLRAPQNGVVTALTKEIGEGVQGIGSFQGEVIMRVSDLTSMEVDVEVNESDIVKVHLGDTASIEVDAYLDQTFRGVVSEIGNTAVNAAGGTTLSLNDVTNFSVKVRVLPQLAKDNIKDVAVFRPGMSATVEISTRTMTDVAAVTIQAVTMRNDTTTVQGGSSDVMQLVVFELIDGVVHQRNVKTGIQDNNYIALKEGPDVGAELVVGPYEMLSRKLDDGDAVEVEVELDTND